MQKAKLKKQIGFFRTVTAVSLILSLSVIWIFLDVHMHLTDPPVRSVEIPDYCGARAEELSFEAWQEVSVTYRHDDTVPSGVVLSQSPAAGSRRKLAEEGDTCRIELVISLGLSRIKLPSVIGMDAREAMETLASLGLKVKTELREGVGAPGRVLAMTPGGGREVVAGSAVTLIISTSAPTETVVVPDVTGLSRADALVALWLAHLEVDAVEEIASEAPAGTVVKQSHRSGTVVRAGTKIKLFISREGAEE